MTRDDTDIAELRQKIDKLRARNLYLETLVENLHLRMSEEMEVLQEEVRRWGKVNAEYRIENTVHKVHIKQLEKDLQLARGALT